MKNLAFLVSILALIYVLLDSTAKAMDRVDVCIEGANRVVSIAQVRDAGVSYETYQAALRVEYAKNTIDEYYVRSALNLARMVYHPHVIHLDGIIIAELFYQECVKEPV